MMEHLSQVVKMKPPPKIPTIPKYLWPKSSRGGLLPAERALVSFFQTRFLVKAAVMA